MDGLCTNRFLLHHAQGYEQYKLINASKREEDDFLKTVQRVEKSPMPVGTNITGSHKLYKIKTVDNEKLQLKAGIAPMVMRPIIVMNICRIFICVVQLELEFFS